MKYANNSTDSDNTWGKIVISKQIVTIERGKSHLYEAICTPNTLTDEMIHIVFDLAGLTTIL